MYTIEHDANDVQTMDCISEGSSTSLYMEWTAWRKDITIHYNIILNANSTNEL